MTRDIDAVITWVNGKDPKHRAKRMQFGNDEILASEDVAGSTRFDSLGEIFWCVASINRFARFIRKIFIVTDGQDPHLDPFLEKFFPEGHIPYEIVEHKTIFKGYEEYLPTFNSITLETMTWRIPGLSDHFIEFNDDFVFNKEVQASDFFTDDGRPVCYADKYNMAWTRFTRLIKPKINGRTRVTFKGNMWNAAKLTGQKNYFLKIDHTPRALSKTFYKNYFTEHEDYMMHNISFRFRNAEQFTPQELQYLSLYRDGNCIIKSVKGLLFFMQPKPRKNYVLKKLQRLERMEDCKFLCFNSVDKASEEDRKRILTYISGRLGIPVESL